MRSPAARRAAPDHPRPAWARGAAWSDAGRLLGTPSARSLEHFCKSPSLLLIDEPTKGVEPSERDKILELLRSLPQEDIAVLMTLDRGTGLFSADRALSLTYGELRGHLAPGLAPVVELPLRVSG